MNKGLIALKNSSIGLMGQIVSIIFQFFTRSIFIHYMGVEMLGLSSTFSSLLNALSVAELGFQTAVVFNLYKPLSTNDKETINNIINIYKLAYRYIGLFFIGASLICIPLMRYIVTDIEITSSVIVIFLLHASSSACTYFLAYKRSLLYADQKVYISSLIDMLFNIVANVIQIIVVVFLKNYIIYLVIKLIQTYASNILVHIICTKNYPYLHNAKIDKSLLKKIASQIKDVFTGKIAGYIYSSTDNLVVSIFVSTIKVGYLNNYTIVTNNIKVIANSITSPISPIIGNIIASSEGSNDQLRIFHIYNYIRFFLSGAIIIPIIILINGFIGMWIGQAFILEFSITLLLSFDLYVHIMHSSCCDYIAGYGLFHIDKYISIVGAILNIVTSVIFVQIIGLPGVLVGTALSQIYFWITRSFVVYKYCFKTKSGSYIVYWMKQLYYFVIFCGVCFIASRVYMILPLDSQLQKFLVGAIMCEIIFVIVALLLCFVLKEQKDLFGVVMNKIKKKFIKTKVTDIEIS